MNHEPSRSARGRPARHETALVLLACLCCPGALGFVSVPWSNPTMSFNMYASSSVWCTYSIPDKIKWGKRDLHRLAISVNGDNVAEFNEPTLTNGFVNPGAMNRSFHGAIDDEFRGRSVCKVVASSDGKLPTEKSGLPQDIQQPPGILEKLDAIYHAISHDETRRLSYMERPTSLDINKTPKQFDDDEERKLISVLRNSLEDAGFELLSKRDIDLCEALNSGYLLRLSIAPDVSELDPKTAQDFYPERFSANTSVLSTDEWPFDGRVLIYRRGYSSEVTRGRLLAPKLDYLQASVVQRSAFVVTMKFGQIEQQLRDQLVNGAERVRHLIRNSLAGLAGRIPSRSVTTFLRNRWGWNPIDQPRLDNVVANGSSNSFFNLARYGGSKNRFMGSLHIFDALAPFIMYEESEDVESTLSGDIPSTGDPANHSIQQITRGCLCKYDAAASNDETNELNDPAVLLERVSISNVVDLSSAEGRKTLLRRFFSTSELVEPTYEEVVTIWRPLPHKTQKKPKVIPPKFVYDMAEIFEWEDRLPQPEEPESEPAVRPLEIRTFDDVPMANVPAVLPKTKLLFRPADAFVFDLVSVLGFLAVVTSQRFNNPKLDILAIVSVSLWVVRTIIRYSNKLARYELLVKKFLTSKIAHRDAGALKYLTIEAGTQRATRASLVYLWLRRQMVEGNEALTRDRLITEGTIGVNELLVSGPSVRVDVDAALNDLEDLDLVNFTADSQELLSVREQHDVVNTLKYTWDNIFDGKISLKGLIGRRRR